MQRASQLFSADDRKQVADAVAAAEANTAAEIVVTVAGASGRYDRAEDIIGLACGLIALAVAWVLRPTEIPERGSWGQSSPALELALLIGATAVGFLLGAAIAHRVGWLRHLFASRRQMHDQVLARAEQTYCDRRIYGTDGSQSVLIFVSLFERLAVIVADKPVLANLRHSALEEICRHLTAQLRHHHPAKAICSTVAETGQRLAAALPKLPDAPPAPTAGIDNSLILLD